MTIIEGKVVVMHPAEALSHDRKGFLANYSVYGTGIVCTGTPIKYNGLPVEVQGAQDGGNTCSC